MYLQLLRDIVKLQTASDKTQDSLAEMRKRLSTAMSDPDVKAEVGQYVTTANRLSKLDLPEINALKQQIADKAQAIFESCSAEIYEAQLKAQEADEALSALLTDPELDQLRRDLDNLMLTHADSEPTQTRHLVFKRGAKLAVAALDLGDD